MTTPASQVRSAMAIVDNIIVPSDRQRQDLGDLTGLKASIASIGLLSPIVVEKHPSQEGLFVLVAGERRLRCVKELGWHAVAIRLFSSLTPVERERIELEENIKRKQLDWREEAKAVHRYVSINPHMQQAEVAESLGVSASYISRCVDFCEGVKSSPDIANATSLTAAVNAIKRKEGRRLDALLDGVEATTAVEIELLGKPLTATNTEVKPLLSPPTTALPWQIMQADFLQWAPQYSGPRFNLIHCDFPYGLNMHNNPLQGQASNWDIDNLRYDDSPELYWALVRCLLDNRPRLIADSSHVIFWLSMKYFIETMQAFTAAGFVVSPFPFIWGKSDGRGIHVDPARWPRRTYETALLMSFGDRKIVRGLANIVWEPTEKSTHMSTKPLPVVKHLMQMFCDESSRVLDPTCGSGTSIAAAMLQKPAYALGLDIDERHVDTATACVRSALASSSLADNIVAKDFPK